MGNRIGSPVVCATVQLGCACVAAAMLFALMPADWAAQVAALPREAVLDLKAVGTGANPGRFAARWHGVVGDEVFAPWLLASAITGTAASLGLQLFITGLRPWPRYAMAAAVAIGVPAALWVLLPSQPLAPTLALKTVGSAAAQLLAWFVLQVGPSAAGVLRDVDENEAWLASMKKPYNARHHIAAQGVFVGLVPDGPWRISTAQRLRPLVLPVEVFHGNHAKLVGASGVGKSKLAGLVLTQLHTHGDAVVVFDPKEDRFLPRVIGAATQASQRPFVYINLRERLPQINPFAGCDQEEIALLLQAGLGLDKSANPAVDFYRGGDRVASGALARTGARDMLALVGAGAASPAIQEHENFWRELQELGRVVAFHTADGPDLAQAIAAGGVIYVVGDTDDLRIVAAQKLLLARITQIIKSRPREGARHVALMLDEYKYLISNAALRALGTLRDRSCNLLLAFQSFGDLKDCPGFSPEAVRGAADNCSLSFVYKLDDRATAEDFARMAGDNRVMVESVDKLAAAQGNLREANRELVSIDMLTTNAPKPLPGSSQASVCWLFGVGRPVPLSTSHLEAGPVPRVVPMPSAGTLHEAIAQGLLDSDAAAGDAPQRTNGRRRSSAASTGGGDGLGRNLFAHESEDPAA